MKFRDLLDLYKKGELPEMEKPAVEEEIDKFEALSDYVFSEVAETETSDMSDFNGINGAGNVGIGGKDATVSQSSDEEDFSKSIKKHIRRAFTKMGIIVLVTVLIVILLVQLVLPPIVSTFYYNPAKKTNIVPGDEDGYYTAQQMDMDFRVFADLNMPLENRTYVMATPLGYGKYNLSFTWTWQSSYDIEKPAVSGQLVRDQLTLSIPNFIGTSHSKFIYSDNVSSHQVLEDGTTVLIPKDEEIAEELKYFSKEELKPFDDDKMLKVAISFKDPISFDEMKRLEDKYELTQAWYAVVVRDIDEEGMSYNDLGFSLTTTDLFHGFDDSNYPNLFSDVDKDTAATKQHFISMLKYMSDQKDFLSMLEESGFGMADRNVYERAYEYIEKNGFSIYGCATFASKKSLLKMIDNDDAGLVRFMEPGQQ